MAQTQAQKRAVNRANGQGAPDVAAVDVRGPLEGEVRNIDVTTVSVTHWVPDGNDAGRGTPDWTGGRWVDFYADGGDVGIVFSADGAVTASLAAKSLNSADFTANSITAKRITAHASNQECIRIPNGQRVPLRVPKEALVFAVIGSAACTLRAHPSEN